MIGKIHNVDNMTGFVQLEKEHGLGSIDLIVTSPPYDDLRTYNNPDAWTFAKFTHVAHSMAESLKEGGVIVWVVNDAVIDGSETLTSLRQAGYFRNECGLRVHDTLIWHKPGQGAYPHPSRYYQAFEYMFVLSKGKPKTFNPIEDVPNKNAGSHHKGKIRSRLPDGSMNKVRDSEFTVGEYGKRSNVWYMPRTDVNGDTKKHPATFPMQLAKDHILSWSNPGDLVCDPFAGSGTTCRAAKMLGRRYIGFEINPTYAELANKLTDRILI